MNKFFSNKRNLIIIISVLSIVVLFIGIYLLLYFSLDVNGGKTIYVDYKSDYIDKGATYKRINLDLSKHIKVKNNVNTKKLGKYKVIYTVKYLFINLKKQEL